MLSGRRLGPGDRFDLAAGVLKLSTIVETLSPKRESRYAPGEDRDALGGAVLRLACLLLTVVTGLTALVYQTAWQKYLTALLGSDSEATVVVLGIFLGGLSCGYSLFGRITRQLADRPGPPSTTRRLLTAYGLVEGAIGLWALLFPLLFAALRSLSLGVAGTSDLLAFVVDVVLTTVLIGPPAVLMGGTVPLLTQALSRGLDDATRFHALVYAHNTTGAFVGALLGGFVVLPRFGLNRVVVGTGLINLVAGATLIALGRAPWGAPGARPARASTTAPLSARSLAAATAVALLSGCAMLTLQVVINRVAAFSFGSSPFTFSIVVATFVSCIALGSFAVSALPRIPAGLLPATQWGLVGCMILLYAGLSDAPYWAHVVRSVFRDHPAAFLPFWLTVLVLLCGVLALPLALSGALLPLLFDRLRREAGTLGRVAGQIYSWNTVGSLLGALGGGYALLYWLDLHQVYRLAVLALAAVATLLSLDVWSGRKVAFLGLGLTLTVLALLPAWPPERLATGLFYERQPGSATYRGPDAFFSRFLVDGLAVAFYEDDPVASIAVIDIPRSADSKIHALFINGKNDSALPGDHQTTGLLALLPALFAEKCERAFVIGYGTGKTVGELAALESVREVVVAEISRGVLHAAPLFEPYNEGALANPKTHVIRGDALRALQRSSGEFDIISSEPSSPWVAGVEALYSHEFFTAARERLSAGGVFVQWIHTYDLDDDTLALVLHTFRRVFGGVAVWHGATQDLLLLGFAEPEPLVDLDRFLARWNRPDYRAVAARIQLADLPAFLAHEVLPAGVVGALELPETVHSLLHPVLNHRATRAFFVGSEARLPVALERRAAESGARNSLARRLMARLPPELREGFRSRMIDETCAHRSRHCAALLAQWQSESPDSPALAQTLDRVRQTHAAAEVTAGLLSKLSTLFHPSGTADVPGEYDYVRRIARSFADYYHHAAPFDAAALHGPIRRCAEQRCASIRAETEGWGVSPPPPPAH